MEKIEATFRVVSPAFMGAADPQNAELRPASIRGLLRYWWRATQPPQNPDALLKKENDLFGSTETGQSKFLLRVTEARVNPLSTGKQVGNGVGYLGYGIAGYDRNSKSVKTTRNAVDAGSQFALQFLFKKDTAERKHELLNALWALTHLGGMGSRSRRGFGSAVVTEVEGADFPTLPRSPYDLAQRIEEKFKELGIREHTALPDYTALSGRTVIRVWPLSTDSWEDALQKVGDRLNAYRSWRQDQKFPDDHDLIWDYAHKGESPGRAPRRAAFGLPHNYFFTSTRTTVNVSGPNNKHDRRASPLLIHLHPLQSRKLVAVLSLIPARFLPDGEMVRVGPAKKKVDRRTQQVADEVVVSAPPDFKPVEDFLSNLPNDALEVKI